MKNSLFLHYEKQPKQYIYINNVFNTIFIKTKY